MAVFVEFNVPCLMIRKYKVIHCLGGITLSLHNFTFGGTVQRTKLLKKFELNFHIDFSVRLFT